jgi:hypothetical protein
MKNGPSSPACAPPENGRSCNVTLGRLAARQLRQGERGAMLRFSRSDGAAFLRGVKAEELDLEP